MLEQLAAPIVSPVSLATAKGWLREASTDFDAEITDLVAAALEHTEGISKNLIVYRPVREQFDSFYQGERHGMIELSGFPVLGVKSITYTDTSGATQTLAASNYLVDRTKSRARITPQWGTFFPPTRPVMNSVQVYYDVGTICPITAVDPVGYTITAPGANKADGDIVQLSLDSKGGAQPPAGLAAGSVYYAKAPTNNGDTFQLASSSGGAAIAITGAGTGPNFVGVLPPRVARAVALVVQTWYDRQGDLTVEQMKAIPVHGVSALLTPLVPRGF